MIPWVLATAPRWLFGGLYLMLLSVALAAGCAPKTTESSAGSGRIRITVSTGPKEGETTRQILMKRRLELFEKHYPDIDVNLTPWDYSPEGFMTRMAGGTCPDVVQVWATEGPGVIDQKLVKDLTPLTEKWDDSPNLRPILLGPFSREGRVYGLPISAYSMALCYNKRLFLQAGIVDDEGQARPPETWEEFVETARRLTLPEQHQVGFALVGATPHAGWHFLNWAWQAGGAFEEEINGKWTATFDREPVAQALRLLQDLRWKYQCTQKSFLLTNDEIIALFATGKAAMIILPVDRSAIVKLKDRYGFDMNDLGITLLPAGPAGRATQFGADYYIINTRVPENRAEACFAWMTFSVSLEWIEAREQIYRQLDRPAGTPEIPIFTGERDREVGAILDRYRNVASFDRYTSRVTETLRAEPPYFCQQLYSQALSPVIQEVLSNPNADAARLLQDSARQFQKSYLDRLNH